MKKPFLQKDGLTLYVGDALKVLSEMPDESVNCIVTSPPYYGLRDYDVKGQIGMETTPHEYVDRLVDAFREARRVLRTDGVLWLNMGDSYARNPKKGGSGTATGRNNRGEGYRGAGLAGLPAKNLIGIPWRVAFGLQADGWILRNDGIWHKSNAMPEGGVRDRLVRDHEYLFLFAKSPRYFFDSDAIVEPAKWDRWGDQTTPKHDGTDTGVAWIKPKSKRDLQRRTTKRKRTVWTIPTANYEGSHFAVFPNQLIEPCVLAGCPEGGVVLDPFIGSGTTAVVALNLNRTCVGIELDKRSAKLCAERIATEHKGAA